MSQNNQWQPLPPAIYALPDNYYKHMLVYANGSVSFVTSLEATPSDELNIQMSDNIRICVASYTPKYDKEWGFASELKPCPFCGGEARFGSEVVMDVPMRHFVYCTACGIQTPRTSQIITEIDAGIYWNKRDREYGGTAKASNNYFETDEPPDDPHSGTNAYGEEP